MRIAHFTHSTNPRGGVVHALELADALHDHGHDAAVIAPDTGAGFFRRARARQLTIPARPCPTLHGLVERRIEEIATHVAADPTLQHDIWHAHCSITANALARLTAEGRIPGFVRTVHHLDDYADPRLDTWQTDGVERADQLFTVSRRVRDAIDRRFRREAVIIGNGVDTTRFSPVHDHTDHDLARRLGLTSVDDPVFLAVGGIEARKNTIAILLAFERIHASHPNARLVVAGGASLLDHSAARAAFNAILEPSQARRAVILPGVIDDADMPALYRRADALVFVSRHEGFGLCPLEAMACGTPVIVSAIPPFTEHFRPTDCLWADPDDNGAIEAAMRAAVAPDARALRSSGPQTAAPFTWTSVARRHLDHYRVRMPTDA